MMGWLQKRKTRRFLRDANFVLAAQILSKQFADSVIPSELAAALDAYLENPGVETALQLVEFDERFLAAFELSKSFLMRDQMTDD